MNTGWWEIDIHGCYLLVKIAFAPICTCKNNRRTWGHNASALHSHDVTDQLWWRHNVNSEKTVHSGNGKMSDQWLFVVEWCVQCMKLHVRNKIIHSLPWMTIFWSLLRWFSLMTLSLVKIICKSPHSWPKIVIHNNSCIILYFSSRRVTTGLNKMPAIS